MAIYEFITQHILPLFGTIGEKQLIVFDYIYWVVVALVVVYWGLWLPSALIRKLARFPVPSFRIKKGSGGD